MPSTNTIKGIGLCSRPSRQKEPASDNLFFTIEMFQKRNKFIALDQKAVGVIFKQFAERFIGAIVSPKANRCRLSVPRQVKADAFDLAALRLLRASFSSAILTCCRILKAESPAAYASIATSFSFAASASSRCSGFSASCMAGDFSIPGRPIKPPQMFGDSNQSVFVCGLIPMRRPIRSPARRLQ